MIGFKLLSDITVTVTLEPTVSKGDEHRRLTDTSGEAPSAAGQDGAGGRRPAAGRSSKPIVSMLPQRRRLVSGGVINNRNHLTDENQTHSCGLRGSRRPVPGSRAPCRTLPRGDTGSPGAPGSGGAALTPCPVPVGAVGTMTQPRMPPHQPPAGDCSGQGRQRWTRGHRSTEKGAGLLGATPRTRPEEISSGDDDKLDTHRWP